MIGFDVHELLEIVGSWQKDPFFSDGWPNDNRDERERTSKSLLTAFMMV